MLHFYIESLIESVTAPAVMGQLIIAVIGLGLAFILSSYFKKYILAPYQDRKWFKGRLAVLWENLQRFATPALAFLLLGIGTIISQRVLGEMALLAFSAHLSVLVLVLRGVNALSPSAPTKAVITFSLVSSLVLSHFDLLEPTFYYLDTIGFTLGNSKISAYKILKTLIIMGFIIWFTRILSRNGEHYIRNIRSVNTDTREWLVKIFEIGLYFVSFLILLDFAGVDLTALAMFGGALGVGLGFGLQKIASNFISGLILLFEKSIQVNDLVELDGSIMGFVKRLEVQNILVEALDGREILVPNEELITRKVTNWSYSSTRARLEVKICVTYATDLDLAKELILASANEHPLSLQYPQPLCFLRNFDNNSIEFTLFFWVADVKQGRLGPRSDIMFAIWRRFREHNIEMGHPKWDVHFSNSSQPHKETDELCLPS